MKYRLAISGSYGGMNLGDEAILEGMLRQLRSTVDADIVIFSHDPKDTEKRHKVRAVPIREMHKDQIQQELRKLDLFILGGGGILYDGAAEDYLRDVNWAQELGIPVMVYAISVGPLKTPESKKLVTDVLNRVDLITVRENEDKRLLNDLDVTHEIVVTADPAFLLESQPFGKELLEKEGVKPESTLIGCSIREKGPAAPDLEIGQYHALLANAADFMVERFKAQILFIPMELGEDRDPQQSHAVISKMAHAQSATVLKGEYSSGQVLGLVKHMAFGVGMRLHFLIFNAIQNVPFFPLPYATKVSGFLADLGIRPPVAGLNIGKLCASLDLYWDTKASLREKLSQRVPILRENAKKTNDLLCQLLKNLVPKEAPG